MKYTLICTICGDEITIRKTQPDNWGGPDDNYTSHFVRFTECECQRMVRLEYEEECREGEG